ncbi:MAG: hypothetical protein K9K66_15540 [Desulfarculaceae bacterium]|nr:hypothetical protein [Desulfarculaceae bacterium]MCF8073547.1 hypothetical protein [Desulfarculaceae bacterium]MCF8103069.1 hypothetical protein [Desulfarculaceae bacterium]MCF8115737.1 hypothetical protein [Desulfarculaceae bacterium]
MVVEKSTSGSPGDCTVYQAEDRSGDMVTLITPAMVSAKLEDACKLRRAWSRISRICSGVML